MKLLIEGMVGRTVNKRKNIVRAFFFIVWICMMLFICASADVRGIGNTNYVIGTNKQSDHNLSVSAVAYDFDEERFELVRTGYVEGVEFGVYTMDQDQCLQPFPDPDHPEEAMTIISGKDASSACLPEGVIYHIRVLSVPSGYVVSGTDTDEFIVEMPASVECSLNLVSTNGVFLLLKDDAGQPLEGAEFILKTDGVSYSLMTDQNGRAFVKDLPAGDYELTELNEPDGYSSGDDATTVFRLAEKEERFFSLVNNRNATVRFNAFERIVARNGEEERVASTDAYELFDADGNSLMTLHSGDKIDLPASSAGTVYSIRKCSDSEETVLLQDEQGYSLQLKSGEDTEMTVILDGDYGDFMFSQMLNGEAVSGGSYVISDAAGNQMLTFEPDEEGHFVSPMLKSGMYTVSQMKAAEGCIYTGDAVQFSVMPYLPEKGEAVSVLYELQTLPDNLLKPLVRSECNEYESLFDSDVNIDVELELLNDFTGWDIENLAVSWNMPEIPGMSVLSADGMQTTLHIEKRAYTPEAPEMESLQISGIVSYQVLYPADNGGTVDRVSVSEPFKVTPAVFSKPQSLIASRYGQVTDENDCPMADVSISIRDDNGNKWETVSDALGNYGFVDAPSELPLKVETDDHHGVIFNGDRITILPLTSVTFLVEADEVGIPFNITLSVEGCEGGLSVQGPGEYTLTGLISENPEVSVTATEGVLWNLSRQDEESYRLAVLPEAIISGRVCYLAGGMADGISIRLSNGSVTTTTEDGQFSFRGLTSGEYTVTPEIPEGMVASRKETEHIDLGIGETETVEFVFMEPATVTGQLKGSRDLVSNVPLSLDPGGQTTATDAEGRFEFEGLSLGTYRLSASAVGNAVLENTSFTVTRSGEQITVEPSFIIPARISGMIWRDNDDDGYLTEKDSAVNNVLVELLAEDGRVLQQVNSQSDGTYEIGGVAAGTYKLRVTLPDGLIFSKRVGSVERVISGVDSSVGESDFLQISEGECLDGMNIGSVATGKIYGFVWIDSNADGVKDADELAYPGAEIIITRSGGIYQQTAMTDTDGRYSFDAIRMGNYELRIRVGEGYFFTRQRAGTAQGSDVLQVDQNEVRADAEIRLWHDTVEVNAGVVKTVSLKVQVWTDSDANGSRASTETGFPGVSVKLYNADGSTQRLLEERLTDSEGIVGFADLRPGKYVVRAIKPETYVNTTEMTVQCTLLENRTLHFGFTKAGSVAGIVFEDSDNDGVRRENENGVRAKVELLNAATGETLMEVRSLPNGRYQFDDILPGTYKVRFTLDEDWRFSSDYRSDAASYNSDVRTMDKNVGTTNAFYVPMSEQVLVDAGAYQTGSVEGKIWLDADENGTFARSENGLSRVVIRLLLDQDIIAEQRTAEDGQFAFESLPPADYVLEAVLPENYYFTMGGAIPGLDSNVGRTQMIHVAGNKTELRIGAVELAQVSGTCEQSGVTILVFRNDDLVSKTVTDSNGDYIVKKLRPGLLRIEFHPEEEYTLAVEGDESQEIRIRQGENRTDINARVIRGAILNGSAWLDENWDGSREDHEQVVEDLTVVLTSQTGYAVSRIPEKDGTFRFGSLRPGRYEISFETDTAITDSALPIVTIVEEGEMKQIEPIAFYIPAIVSGTVWDDLDGNNYADTGETGVEHVKVSLLSERTGMVLAESTTDQEGKYQLEKLMPGVFVIRFSLPTGYLLTYEDDSERTIELTMGETLENVDVSVLRSGTVGDTVWFDENENGIQDTGESGVSGVEVQIWRLSDEGEWVLLSEVTTDVNGRYRARDVRPGMIRIAFRCLEGYTATEINEGYQEFNSKVNEERNGYWWTEDFRLLSGERRLNLDAGIVPVTDYSLSLLDSGISDVSSDVLTEESDNQTENELTPPEQDIDPDDMIETETDDTGEGNTEEGEVFFF